MKRSKWFFVMVCVCCLIGVRMVESKFFYDPFLDFFKDLPHGMFPNFEWRKLVLSHILRFIFNLMFSLGIIYFLFRDRKWTFQAGILIILSFIIFFPIYLYCLYTRFEFGELFAFYVRRIVIQPVPLLVLIPMFYYLAKT